MDRFLFNDPFLRRLTSQQVSDLEYRLRQWELTHTAFTQTLDSWFGNFEPGDKELALKLLFHIDYYSPRRFSQQLRNLSDQVRRRLHDRGLHSSSLIVVTPDGGGDSAHRHAYDLSKAWRLPVDSICTVTELDGCDLSNTVLVLFNDTYGSGSQFSREMWPAIAKIRNKPQATFVVGVAIAKAALQKFEIEFSDVEVLPAMAAVDAANVFTDVEHARLEELGRRVYSKHPLGYGKTQLLTAYYFQCPNNTLPLVWADGDNNSVNGSCYPWSPLFPYKPKVLTASSGSFGGNQQRTKNRSRILIGRLDSRSDHTKSDTTETAVFQDLCPVPRLFLHFLDQHYLVMKAANLMHRQVMKECRLATRLALLAADKVLISASWYFESIVCRRIIDEFRFLFDRGHIWMLGEATSISEYQERKLGQFPIGSSRHNAYFQTNLGSAPPFSSRKTNATDYIIKRWQLLLNAGAPRAFAELDLRSIPKDFERRWERIPERLGRSAFIVEHIQPLLFEGAFSQVQTNQLYKVLNKAFFESFTNEHASGIVTDLVYLNSPISINSHGVDLPYRKLCQELRQRNILRELENLPPAKLLNFRNDPRWQLALRSVLLNWQPLFSQRPGQDTYLY